MLHKVSSVICRVQKCRLWGITTLILGHNATTWFELFIYELIVKIKQLNNRG